MRVERRRDAELIELSGRLLHDVQVFFHVSRALVRTAVGFDKPPTWEVETALVESFALHTRALVDFFYANKPSKRDQDNAYAIDFFDPPAVWPSLRPDQGRWLSAIRLRALKDVNPNVDRFGEHVGHLTYADRPVSDYARGWPTVQVTRAIGAAVRVFGEHVDSAKVEPDFKAKARRELPAASKLDEPRQAMALWTPPVAPRRLASQ